MNWMMSALAFLYAAVGALVIIGYFPTMKDLWVHRKKSANTSSYVIWTLSSSIGLLYSLIFLQDWLVRIAATVNMACCATILILAMRLK